MTQMCQMPKDLTGVEVRFAALPTGDLPREPVRSAGRLINPAQNHQFDAISLYLLDKTVQRYGAVKHGDPNHFS